MIDPIGMQKDWKQKEKDVRRIRMKILNRNWGMSMIWWN